MKLKHILITRFNLKIWKTDKTDTNTLSEEWLEDRFELFEKFCFPSVFNQSDKNFNWFCFFDVDTPARFKLRIEQYQSSFEQFVPVFLSEVDCANNYNTKIKQTIASEFCLNGADVLITTRLDNDDSIHCDFICEVNLFAQQTSHSDSFCVYNYGYQYFYAQNLLTRIKYPNNHFFSRIEKNPTAIRTVLALKHSHIRKKSITSKTPVVAINNSNKPFWIEVIHERNVANDLYIAFRVKNILNFFLTRPILKDQTLTEFGIDVTLTKKNELRQFLFFFIPRVLHIIGKKLFG